MNIKFVCLNLWLGGKLWEPMLAYLKDVRADILVCQEVYNGEAEHLKPQFRSVIELKMRLGYKFCVFAGAFLSHYPGEPVVQGNAVFSKFPLVERETVFYNEPFGERKEELPELFLITPRKLQHVVVTLPKSKELHVFNTQGVWDYDGFDNPKRTKMCQVITREVGGIKPTLLAGDFNMFPNTQGIGLIEKVMCNLIPKNVKTTFNMKQKPASFVPNVVDMVFASDDIEVKSVRVPNVDVSDHLPIEVELKL